MKASTLAFLWILTVIVISYSWTNLVYIVNDVIPITNARGEFYIEYFTNAIYQMHQQTLINVTYLFAFAILINYLVSLN